MLDDKGASSTGPLSLNTPFPDYKIGATWLAGRFAVRILVNPMPDDLPLRLNGTPQDLPLPEPDEALAILVSEEAEEYRLEIQQALRWIAVRLKVLGHEAALLAAFRKRMRSLPDVVGLDRVGNAAMMATRVHRYLRDGRIDALTQGLALAIARWTDHKRLGEIRVDENRRLRNRVGLTQANWPKRSAYAAPRRAARIR